MGGGCRSRRSFPRRKRRSAATKARCGGANPRRPSAIAGHPTEERGKIDEESPRDDVLPAGCYVRLQSCGPAEGKRATHGREVRNVEARRRPEVRRLPKRSAEGNP